MSENNYYDKIIRLNNSQDIKKILGNWENFSNNRTRSFVGQEIVLPDMLWVSSAGIGKTSLLSLISEYLYTKKLMDFYGDVKYFEYVLQYRSKDNNANIQDDFNSLLVNAAGFRNEYKGVVYIDVSDWIEHTEDKDFLNFIRYLSDNSNSWHIIFNINCYDKNRTEKLETLLAACFRIEKVVFALPDNKELGEYMKNYLANYGFKLENDALDILVETIGELRKNKYFDGYKTLNMICADLIYRELSSDDFSGDIITTDTVRYYSKDSEFVRRTKTNIEKRKQIGFN
ncbi:MAG: hypothetical protein LIO65_01445 [Odoribacter sp.]|nr:hypothetical protein [Odoribacter sp.]